MSLNKLLCIVFLSSITEFVWDISGCSLYIYGIHNSILPSMQPTNHHTMCFRVRTQHMKNVTCHSIIADSNNQNQHSALINSKKAK